MVSRKEAIAAGLKHYTGKPCQRGHVGKRYVSCGGCVECRYEQTRIWQLANPEKSRGYTSKYARANTDKAHARYLKNSEKYKAKATAWHKANPEKARESARKWQRANPEKMRAAISAWKKANAEKHKAAKHAWYLTNPKRYIDGSRAWAKANPGKRAAQQAKRKAAKLQRTPAWADDELIELVYTVCPNGQTVDHVLPLQGKTVSGLHVHQNLAYLTRSENSRKGNRLEL